MVEKSCTCDSKTNKMKYMEKRTWCFNTNGKRKWKIKNNNLLQQQKEVNVIIMITMIIIIKSLITRNSDVAHINQKNQNKIKSKSTDSTLAL